MRKLRKILHVEDDTDILEVTRMALEGLNGLEVASCRGWREAIARAPGYAPDLFLLDVMMPEKSGPETLAELRRLPGLADTPAIFMTAKVQLSEVRLFLDAGGIAVVTKPFDPMTLGDQICEEWAKHFLMTSE
jgi:two-component system, OmpR family, response regulator